MTFTLKSLIHAKFIFCIPWSRDIFSAFSMWLIKSSQPFPQTLSSFNPTGPTSLFHHPLALFLSVVKWSLLMATMTTSNWPLPLLLLSSTDLLPFPPPLPTLPLYCFLLWDSYQKIHCWRHWPLVKRFLFCYVVFL